MRPIGLSLPILFIFSLFVSSYSFAVPANIGPKRHAELNLLIRGSTGEREYTSPYYRGWPLVGSVQWGHDGSVYGIYCPLTIEGKKYLTFKVFDVIPNAQMCYSGTCPAGTVPMPNSTDCQPADTTYYSAHFPEQQNSQCNAGNPIDVSSGSKIQTEIHIPNIGQTGLKYNYSYSSTSTGRWQHNYQKKLKSLSDQADGYAKSANHGSASAACLTGWIELRNKISNNAVAGGTPQFTNNRCLISVNGKTVKEIPVQANSSNSLDNFPAYIQISDATGSVTTYRGSSLQTTYQDINGGKNLLIKDQDFWRLVYSSGIEEHYDFEGRLTKIISANSEQQLTYNANGLLTNLIDNQGHQLTFAYTNTQLTSVTLDNTKTTTYTYAANGLIERITHPDNTFRIYHYEDSRFPTALTGITDERNVRYATWAYDAQGRAISSEHAGGAEKTLLNFNADGSTTVTNSLGKQTIYRFDYINGAKRVVKVEGQASANCLAANKDYTYTPEGWLESKTDWKGIKTTYAYNALGQEIFRTEAFGTPEVRIIKTEWHSTLYLKTKITEPEREITFEYDNKGRMVYQKTRSLITQ